MGKREKEHNKKIRKRNEKLKQNEKRQTHQQRCQQIRLGSKVSH
jgi:hypothetical protein